MTIVVPNVPTPVPTRADPANFAERADAYHTALPGIVEAMNLQNAENNSLNSSTASLKTQTEAVATSVALTAGVTAWNAVAVYVVGSCVFDPVDFLTYRRKVYGSSGTRPGLDAGNWALLTGFGDVTLNGVQTLTNKTLTSPSLSGVTVTDGTANGVLYLNGSKVATSGSALTFDGAGNLGLGVTPSAWGAYRAMQVNNASISSITATSAVLSANAFNNNGAGWKYIGSNTATSYEQFDGGHYWSTAPSGIAGQPISFTQAMTLDASGNLGVGTANPLYRAHFSSNAGGVDSWVGSQNTAATTTLGAGFLAIAGAPSYYTTFKQRANGDAEIFHSNPTGSLLFGTTAIERARIDSSGNLLVGKTAPTHSVDGATFSNIGSNFSGTSANVLAVNRNGTDGVLVSFHKTAVDVGNIYVTASTTSYNTSSDYRLKNITGPITTSGAYIDSLNPVEGTWKADGSTFVGLIAHEVQEASRTQIATGEKDGEQMQAMDYSSSELIANLIAEVKSLRARVAALESN